MNDKLICLIGPDGTGKSTQAILLINYLKEKGFDYKYRWLRFFHLFCLPLLAFARLTGMSEVKILQSGKKISYHFFYKSRFFSYIYALLLFIDTLINIIIKIYIPLFLLNENIICDRFIYDTLVDLMISTRRYNIYNSFIGKAFLHLIPKGGKALMLIAEGKILRARRDDIEFDETLDERLGLYNALAITLNIKTFDAGLSVDVTNDNIIKYILI